MSDHQHLERLVLQESRLQAAIESECARLRGSRVVTIEAQADVPVVALKQSTLLRTVVFWPRAN